MRVCYICAFAVLLGCASVWAENTGCVPTPAQQGAVVVDPHRVEISAKDAPIEVVLAELSSMTSTTITARGETSGAKISIEARKLPLESVLDQLVREHQGWLWYQVGPGKYEIWDQASFRGQVLSGRTQERVFNLRDITAMEAQRAIQGVLTPNIGTAAVDNRSNTLIVRDVPPVLELVGRLLDQIDVKFEMHVFKLEKAPAETMGQQLSMLKSSNSSKMIVDSRTNQIVVFERPEVIKQMEAVAKVLDVQAAAPTGPSGPRAPSGPSGRVPGGASAF